MTTASEALTSAHRPRQQRVTSPLLRPGTSELWLSDHPAERREAVKLCRGCTVIVECRTAADARDERWRVWGG
jgi:hypothetical protein